MSKANISEYFKQLEQHNLRIQQERYEYLKTMKGSKSNDEYNEFRFLEWKFKNAKPEEHTDKLDAALNYCREHYCGDNMPFMLLGDVAEVINLILDINITQNDILNEK